VFQETVTAVGASSGVKKARVKRGIFRFANSTASDAITIADKGATCFIVDDQTVAKTDGSASRSVAGVITDVDSAGVWVYVGSVNGTALAAEIASRQALPATVADTASGIPVVIPIAVADGVTGNVDITVAAKTQITGVTFLKNTAAGGASDTIQLANGATTNYLCNAMDINVAANTTVRNTTIISTYAQLSAGATLRVVRTKASAANVGGTVLVHGYKVA
jgi:hypothetical protein